MRFAASSLLIFALAAMPLGGAGCGGSSEKSDTGAIEDRIDRERAEAANTARQEERIRQLERKAAQVNQQRRGRTVTTVVTKPTPAPSVAPAQPTVPSPSDDAWPGGSGQTVVLASLTRRGAARQFQQRAARSGLDAGVLYSSNYSSLRPGYWVAFSGKFDTTEMASQRQARARSLGFADAYVRFVSP